MITGKSVLAIIPARGGSKGLPGKNIKELCGKPLIAWSIEQAKSCSDIDRIVVSTDNEEIAEVAKKYGAEVPFIRPAELANDTASTIDVIFHATNWFKEHKDYRSEYILLLQPTSPLRIAEDIEGTVQMLKDKNARAVVSVCETALGNGIKKPSSSELKNIPIARKSIVAAKNIRKGESFTEENLAVKRPGTGISPMRWDEILGKHAQKKYVEDELI